LRRLRPHCGTSGERATDRRDHSRSPDRVVGARAVVGPEGSFGPRAGRSCPEFIRGTAIKVVHDQLGRRLALAIRVSREQRTGDAAAQRTRAADLATWRGHIGRIEDAERNGGARVVGDEFAADRRTAIVRHAPVVRCTAGRQLAGCKVAGAEFAGAEFAVSRRIAGVQCVGAKTYSRSCVSIGGPETSSRGRRVGEAHQSSSGSRGVDFGVRLGSAIGRVRQPRERRAAGPGSTSKGLQGVCVARHEWEPQTLQSAGWADGRSRSGAGTAGATEGCGAPGRNGGPFFLIRPTIAASHGGGPRRLGLALVQSAPQSATGPKTRG
jgi:hypothetical protein